MMKRLITVVLILAVAITAAGCGGKSEPAGDPTVPDASRPTAESGMPVFDKDGNLLGEIDSRANCTAVDGGIFYSVTDLKEYQLTADAEYRFLDMESKRDVRLGMLENQGYEAAFARTEYHGNIFTLAVQGDPVSDPAVPLVLLAADPAAGTMKKYTVSENGFPYASLAAANGKLLIMSHEMSEPKRDQIIEFDPAAETMREVLTFSPDTDSLRGVCPARDGFFLLRLKINNGGENELVLDRYDHQYARVSEQSVNETMIHAVMEIRGITERQDALNELGMNVSRFAVEEDRYLIYENFGLSRLIIDLHSGETVLARDDIYAVSLGSGTPFVYRIDFDSEDAGEPDISGVIDGELTKLSFEPTDPHKLIQAVSHAADGTWLIMTSDGSPVQDRTYALHCWTGS